MSSIKGKIGSIHLHHPLAHLKFDSATPLLLIYSSLATLESGELSQDSLRVELVVTLNNGQRDSKVRLLLGT
jgi:hypothetical protein